MELVGAVPTRETAPPFDAFFTAEYRRVAALALVLTGRRAVAEECAQDAFVAAFRRWDRISAYDDPGAWVRRVVINLATSTLRRRAREARALARVAFARQQEVTAFDDEFWAAVRALPRRQAQCVALHYLEDRSVADIAGLLRVAPATVRVHLHEGRSALAKVLREDEA